MAAYYLAQGYDLPASDVWAILTDFGSWPEWFPRVSSIVREPNGPSEVGTALVATGEQADDWTRWQITEWSAPHVLVCEHVRSNSSASPFVEAASLQFELLDDEDGCTLEVEISADGRGLVGGFFLDMTLGPEVRRLLPELVDAFSDHVVRRVRAGRDAESG